MGLGVSHNRNKNTKPAVFGNLPFTMKTADARYRYLHTNIMDKERDSSDKSELILKFRPGDS